MDDEILLSILVAAVVVVVSTGLRSSLCRRREADAPPIPAASPTTEEDDSSDDEDEREPSVEFVAASTFMANPPVKLNLQPTQQLVFYSLYKQATVGDNESRQPSMLEMTGRAKWDAWDEVRGLSDEMAEQSYVQALNALVPNWRELATAAEQAATDSNVAEAFESAPPDNGGGGGGGPMGPVGSTMYQVEEFVGEREAVDFAKEGDLDQLRRYEQLGDIVNDVDDEGMTMMHWVCDRGHNSIVEHLLENDADFNAQDAEGQTPLHLAVTCEHLGIVKLLVAAGADQTLKDSDGYTAADAAETTELKLALAPT